MPRHDDAPDAHNPSPPQSQLMSPEQPGSHLTQCRPPRSSITHADPSAAHVAQSGTLSQRDAEPQYVMHPASDGIMGTVPASQGETPGHKEPKHSLAW